MGENPTPREFSCPKCKTAFSVVVADYLPTTRYEVNEGVKPHEHRGICGFDKELWEIACTIGHPFTRHEFVEKCLKHHNYVLGTLRRRLTKWVQWGMLKTKVSKPDKLNCPACGKTQNIYSLIGTVKTERKRKAGQINIRKNSRYDNKREVEIWEIIAQLKGNFTAADIKSKHPDIPLPSIRHFIYKWLEEGWLVRPEYGYYKVKKARK